MEHLTAVHEAGHALAAESLGLKWTLHRGTGAEDYLAKVTTQGNWQWERRAFIDLCGPYAEAGLGEIVSEDYHWQFINHLPEKAKAKFESEAEEFVYNNWSRIMDLADEFVGASA